MRDMFESTTGRLAIGAAMAGALYVGLRVQRAMAARIFWRDIAPYVGLFDYLPTHPAPYITYDNTTDTTLWDPAGTQWSYTGGNGHPHPAA